MENEIVKINYQDLTNKGFDGGGSEILYYRDTPFTGIVCDYEDDESLAYEIEYKDGFLEGVQKYYFSNGKLEEEYVLQNNLLNGIYRIWDAKGDLLQETTWAKGEKVE